MKKNNGDSPAKNGTAAIWPSSVESSESSGLGNLKLTPNESRKISHWSMGKPVNDDQTLLLLVRQMGTIRTPLTR